MCSAGQTAPAVGTSDVPFTQRARRRSMNGRKTSTGGEFQTREGRGQQQHSGAWVACVSALVVKSNETVEKKQNAISEDQK